PLANALASPPDPLASSTGPFSGFAGETGSGSAPGEISTTSTGGRIGELAVTVTPPTAAASSTVRTRSNQRGDSPGLGWTAVPGLESDAVAWLGPVARPRASVGLALPAARSSRTWRISAIGPDV